MQNYSQVLDLLQKYYLQILYNFQIFKVGIVFIIGTEISNREIKQSSIKKKICKIWGENLNAKFESCNIQIKEKPALSIRTCIPTDQLNLGGSELIL